jgi:hypothetical protein
MVEYKMPSAPGEKVAEPPSKATARFFGEIAGLPLI